MWDAVHDVERRVVLLDRIDIPADVGGLASYEFVHADLRDESLASGIFWGGGGRCLAPRVGVFEVLVDLALNGEDNAGEFGASEPGGFSDWLRCRPPSCVPSWRWIHGVSGVSEVSGVSGFSEFSCVDGVDGVVGRNGMVGGVGAE